MSFLNLGRLLAPRKVWKVFINKLQLKFHKLNRSKAIKKLLPKIQFHNKASKNLGLPQFLSIQPKKFKHNRRPRTLVHLQKPTPPLYIDQILIDPPLAAKKLEKSWCSSNDDQKSNAIAADEMWESMVFASPYAQGINRRADEFIATFRSQLRRQEMQARRRRL